MTPKERRDRLFKSGRPFIRPIQLYEGENYGRDISVLWVGHKKQPFAWLDKDLSQEQFARRVEEISQTEELFISEDKNPRFKEGEGMVGVISLTSDGWKYEPHVQFMPWATSRNVLRTTIAFLQFVRYSKKVGVIVVYSLETSVPLFNKCCDYGVLHRVGKIVNGDPEGDEFVYSVAGKRKINAIKGNRSDIRRQQKEFSDKERLV